MRPRTDEHDIDVKTRKIQQFLAEGDRVRVSVQFRGAEMRHPDIGRKLLDEIAEVLKGSAIIERTPSMEGRMMSMIVSRAPGWEPPKKQAPPTGKHHASSAPTEKTASTGETTPDTVYPMTIWCQSKLAEALSEKNSTRAVSGTIVAQLLVGLSPQPVNGGNYENNYSRGAHPRCRCYVPQRLECRCQRARPTRPRRAGTRKTEIG